MSKLDLLRAAFQQRKMLVHSVVSYLTCLHNQEQSIWGSITKEDEQGILRALELSADLEGPIIEVGVLFGHTTNLLASNKKLDKGLIAVENFVWNPFFLPPDVHRLFTQRTLRYAMRHGSVELFDGDSRDFYAQHATLRPSMMFIDAGHDYDSVRQDLDWATAVGCPVISGHDYAPIHPGVMKAVDERFGKRIERHGSVWIHHQAV